MEVAGQLRLKREIYNEALLYYRKHADEFVNDVMGVKLNLYQMLLVRAFFQYSFLVWIMCRGTGKTFTGVLCIVTYCLLYGNTKAGIVAPSFRQGRTALDEKYKQELCSMSPFLEQEERTYTCSTQKAKVEFYNGSWIEAYPIGSDGAKIRGARLHICLIDEAAYVPKVIIDNVVKPMMVVKRGYKVGEKQDDYSGNKVLMCSTASYRFNFLYDLFCLYFNEMIKPTNTKYFAMTLPYAIGVQCGLFDEEIVNQQKATMPEMQFEMEYLGRFPRLVEHAWIKYEDLQKCSDLKFLETEGKEDCEYIMSIDVARKEGQDNTVINVFKVYWCSDHVELDLVYIHALNGCKFEEQAKNVRMILKKFPNVIKIFQDTVTIGQGLTDELAKPYFDEETQKYLPPLIDCNDKQAMRNIYRTNGIPLIYGITANPELNHKMGMTVKTFTEKGWVHFYPFNIEEERNLTSEEEALVNETEKMRMEVINIEVVGLSGNWTKFGTKSKRKDRWSALNMGIYGATILFQDKVEQKDNEHALISVRKRRYR